MGKRQGKSAKLDLILSELSKAKAELRKLLKNQAAVADRSVKASSRPPRAHLPKKASKRQVTIRKPGRGVAPSRPVLVEVPQSEQTQKPTSRTA
jgi:hypothetical protein